MQRTTLYFGISLVFGVFAAGTLLAGGGIASLLMGVPFLLVVGGVLGGLIATHGVKACQKGLLELAGISSERLGMAFGAVVLEEVTRVGLVARKEGLLALDKEQERLQFPFLKRAIKHLADGMEGPALRALLELLKNNDLSSRTGSERFFENAASLAPSIGVMASVVCLVPALQSMGSPGGDASALGLSVSMSLVSFLYGMGLGQLVFNPMAEGLKREHECEAVLYAMVVEGVSGIHEGASPQVLRARLESLHRSMET